MGAPGLLTSMAAAHIWWLTRHDLLYVFPGPTLTVLKPGQSCSKQYRVAWLAQVARRNKWRVFV
jgi:hypothetical protein